MHVPYYLQNHPHSMNLPLKTRRHWLKIVLLFGASAVLGGATSSAESAQWTDRPTVQLKGLRVTCSEPVLVKRSRWFCWFPSLIRQPDGTLWAVINPCADIQVSESFGYLSRSRDGGLTWDEPRVIGDSGSSHLLLPDGGALVIPYSLRPRAGGAIGAPCNIISPTGKLTMRAAGVTVDGWPKPAKMDTSGLGTAGFVFDGSTVLGRNHEYLTTLYGHFEGDKRFSLVLAESADGFAWHIRAVIAGADCLLEGREGPCESAMCRLADGRLMCVFRLDSYASFGQTFSADDGKTWSQPVSIAPNSVDPRLEVMPGGTLVLSTGRPGMFVWFDLGGTGADWQAVDILAQHNAARPADLIDPDTRQAWTGVDKMLREGRHGYTSSYTELLRIDDKHLLLIYDRVGLGWNAIPDESPETNSVWVMRLTVEK